MWLFTKEGFFSIVKVHNKDRWFVRARCLQDLDNLIKKSGVKASPFETLDNDYHYRIEVCSRSLELIYDYLGKSIDYGNFKEKVGQPVYYKGKIVPAQSQNDKLLFYEDIWESMFRYQTMKSQNLKRGNF